MTRLGQVEKGAPIADGAAVDERIEDLSTEPPLCVDLDGCLVRSDTFVESLLVLLASTPFYLFAMIMWALRGKVYFKNRLSAAVRLNVTNLPYNEELVAFIRQERAKGRRIVLATASHRSIAERVASHTGLFDEIIATDAYVNLKGSNKRAHLVGRFGERGFDYVGNSPSDLAIFGAARQAIFSGHTSLLRGALSLHGDRRVTPLGDQSKGRAFEHLRAALRALRPHQWSKNLLLFVPLILAHRLNDPQRIAETLLGVVSFCLCASGAYALNDLLDLPADRVHPTKRRRPLAAGDLSIVAGIHLVWLLPLAGLGVAFVVAGEFWRLVLLYYVATVAYSLVLKRRILLDVMTLAGLYTLRLVAGGAAANAPISAWLAVFAVFFFLSLALAKRYGELRRWVTQDQQSESGRGYVAQDLMPLQQLGIASGLIAPLVMGLYLYSAEIRTLYSHPQWLWAVCALLTYWIGRVWILAGRGVLSEDPLLFALRDPASYLIGAICGLLILLAQ